MSYCRKDENSDVYVYQNGPELICHGLDHRFATDTPSIMDGHLRTHQAAGDLVPEGVIGRMEVEEWS